MFSLRQFARDCSGQVTLIFAAVALPVAVAAGVAIDYNRVSRDQLSLQAALDSAVLAAGAKSTFDADTAAKYFARNQHANDGITINSLAFKSEGNGVVSGTAQATVPLGMLGIAGLGRPKITVSTRAKSTDVLKMSETEFKITNAQGAYDKEIYLFTKDKDGKITSETLVLSYDYTYTSSGGTKTFSPSMTASKTASVGPYDTVGQKMVVYEDNTYRGRKVNPKAYFSDDKAASSWTKSTGNCTDKAGQTQNWEDGGDSNYMDFVFNVKCKTVTSGSRTVRLLK